MNNAEKMNYRELVRPTLSNKLTILFCTFVVMLIITGFISSVIQSSGLSARNAFLSGSIVQSLLAFIVPSWLVSFLCASDSGRYLGISEGTALRQYVGAVIIMFLFTPALNAVIEWNAGISLPDAFKGLEAGLRKMEDAAAETTAVILGVTSWWGLVSGILVVGCLTGFSEEMLFRGGLQKALSSSGINIHIAVWASAFIFSAIHFQFFGFIPRMLLGACFGYAYAYCRSIWIPAFMHALNNSVVVVTAWLSGRSLINVDIESIGTYSTGQIWFAIMSALTCGFFIYFFGSYLMKSPGDKQNHYGDIQ
ncbi:MAG: CPBP family intramembrane metalloprotease [Muribaculaceae bacterium]|nr:CPBP family intramembrane metalloprotease [Muribaculaceae bacterium]